MDFKEIISRDYCERLFLALLEIEAVDHRLTRETLAEIDRALPGLELKARVNLVAKSLQVVLAPAFSTFEARLDALLSLRERARLGSLDEHGETTASFELWPLTAWIGMHGLDHPEAALGGLKELTCYFTAEFDVRPFLERHRALTLATLKAWRTDENKHVRRLVSEGTRAYLPWGTQVQWLKDEPEVVLELIRDLRDDPAVYVRRSVANNLNDMTREHPELVIAELQAWAGEEQEGGAEEVEINPQGRRWIMKHALRSLVKRGDEAALSLLGFHGDVQVELDSFESSDRVVLDGKPLQLQVTLRSTGDEPQQLVLDYIIHHVKANGQHSAKVFKWKTFTLPPAQSRTLKKNHPIKTITTRRYFEGTHKVEIQLNGKVLGSHDFTLEVGA